MGLLPLAILRKVQRRRRNKRDRDIYAYQELRRVVNEYLAGCYKQRQVVEHAQTDGEQRRGDISVTSPGRKESEADRKENDAQQS